MRTIRRDSVTLHKSEHRNRGIATREGQVTISGFSFFAVGIVLFFNGDKATAAARADNKPSASLIVIITFDSIPAGCCFALAI